MPRPTRALLTGASGFVGSFLARRLLGDGLEVHLTVRPDSDRWRLRGLETSIHELDLADLDMARAVIREARPEWIFHLAAHGAYAPQRDLRQMLESNLLGTMNLLSVALDTGFDAFVHSGSSSEYGLLDHAPSEDEAAMPRSHYAVTKLAATLHCQATAMKHGLPLSILRLYSVYGPYEAPTRLVPALALSGLDRRLPRLVDPEVARDFVYVEDVAEAYLLAARAADATPGVIYNVGTGRQRTIRDAVAVARSHFDIHQEPEFGSMSNRAWDTSTWVANPGKMARELGFQPKVTFEEGFSRFVRWLEEEPGRLDEYRRRAGD